VKRKGGKTMKLRAKRLLALAMAGVMALSMAGCGVIPEKKPRDRQAKARLRQERGQALRQRFLYRLQR
jgi:ABC-type uncharacterized transport system auxiliary subunit